MISLKDLSKSYHKMDDSDKHLFNNLCFEGKIKFGQKIFITLTEEEKNKDISFIDLLDLPYPQSSEKLLATNKKQE